jgi:hypothetical protein
VVALIEERPVDVMESRWVVSQPSYQVQFWHQLNDPEPPLVPLWSCYSTRLVGVSEATEALAWAEARANGRRIVLYAEVDRGDDVGLVRLHGIDPTRGGD